MTFWLKEASTLFRQWSTHRNPNELAFKTDFPFYGLEIVDFNFLRRYMFIRRLLGGLATVASGTSTGLADFGD